MLMATAGVCAFLPGCCFGSGGGGSDDPKVWLSELLCAPWLPSVSEAHCADGR